MEKNLIIKKSIIINAEPSMVWDALTNPEKIRQYLFGTNAISDWEVGSPITYEGVYQGKAYKDRGTILQSEPERIFQSTYWSSMSGTEDKPENYATVTYELSKENNGTRLTLTQDNCKTPEQKKHLEGNWAMVLEGLKKVAEDR